MVFYKCECEREMQLYEFQTNAVNNVRQAFKNGKRRLILVSPTGSGKTTMAAAMMQGVVNKGKRALFVAHRREIIKQTAARFRQEGIESGVIMSSERPDLNAQVQVCSIDTLRARSKQNGYPPADLIIIDECHRTSALSYLSLIESAPNAYLIGLTATPYRADDKSLGDVYTDAIIAAAPKELIDAGILATPRMFTTPNPIRAGNARVVSGDYLAEDLQNAAIELSGDVFDNWRRLASDRKTIVFSVNVAHANALHGVFANNGVRCQVITGTTKTHIRDGYVEELHTGGVQVIINCQVFIEGFDCPPADCCVIALPTLSKGRYIQMAGRVLRRFEGKRDALILDHGENVQRHGLITDPVEFDLTPAKEKRKLKAELCESKEPMEQREIQNTQEELEEVDIWKYNRISDPDLLFYLDTEKKRRSMGYSLGWTFHKLKEKGLPQDKAYFFWIGKSPSKLGEIIGNVSAVAINKRLSKAGLQENINGEWILTDKGMDFGEYAEKYVSERKTVRFIRWSTFVISELGVSTTMPMPAPTKYDKDVEQYTDFMLKLGCLASWSGLKVLPRGEGGG